MSVERFARDNIRFCFGDENLADCDYAVVYGSLPKGFKFTLPKHRAIFVSGEPVNVCRYHKNFLAQFGTIITSDRDTPHPNRLFVQGGLPWTLGLLSGANEYRREPMTIDTFRRYAPTKTKLVSVICSNKVLSEQYRSRLSFLARLRAHFGERLDVFGRGINPFVDKEEVIAPYRYHIVLENSTDKDYWTEKISDPILALTYPIYSGCENLEDYLPSDCFTRIDISQPEQAIAVIESVIASDIDETKQAALRRARELILDEHNIFELLARVVKKLQSSPPTSEASALVTLRRNGNFKPKRRIRRVFHRFEDKYRAFRYNRKSQQGVK